MEITAPNEVKKVNRIRVYRSTAILALTYLVIVAYIVFGNAATFNIGQRLPVKVAELLSLPLILVYLFKYHNIKKVVKIRFPRLFIVWCVFDIISILYNAIAMQYGVFEIAYGTIYLMRVIHIVLVSYVIVVFLRYYRVPFKKIRNIFIYSYLVVCVIGIIQYFMYPVVADWYQVFYNLGVYWPTPDPHLKRVVSTYFDPNYLASILVIPMLLDIALLLYSRKKIVSMPQLIFELLIMSITMLLTKSRSGIVGLLIGSFILILYLLVHKKVKLIYYAILLAVAILLGYLLLFSDITVFERIRTFKDDASAAHRFDSWAESIEYILDNPIFGVGYNLFGNYTEKLNGTLNTTTGYGVDSSFFLILITTGFVGGALFITAGLKYTLRKNKSIIHLACKSILVASFVMSFFNNLLFNVLWIMPICMLMFITDSYPVRRVNRNV